MKINIKKIIYVGVIYSYIACNYNSNQEVSSLDTPHLNKNSLNHEANQNKLESDAKQQLEVRFDKIRPLLIQELSNEKINEIEMLLKTEIALSDGIGKERIFTKSLQKFLDEMPDFIMIEMEPDLEKKFKKKWAKKYDVHNTNFMHPFYDGNGGCESFKLEYFKYLGTYNDAYFVETKIRCSMDETESVFKRYFKIIESNGTYMIDGVYNFN